MKYNEKSINKMKKQEEPSSMDSNVANVHVSSVKSVEEGTAADDCPFLVDRCVLDNITDYKSKKYNRIINCINDSNKVVPSCKIKRMAKILENKIEQDSKLEKKKNKRFVRATRTFKQPFFSATMKVKRLYRKMKDHHTVRNMNKQKLRKTQSLKTLGIHFDTPL